VVFEQPAIVVEERMASPPIAAASESLAPGVTLVSGPVAIAKPDAAEDLAELVAGQGFELPARGLGVEPGRVAIKVGPIFVECRVDAWNDTGLAATVPEVALAEATPAELLAAAADGTPLVRMPVRLLPTAAAR
jgi:hypothetical protein